MGKFVKKQSLQCRVGILKTRSLQYMEKLVKKTKFNTGEILKTQSPRNSGKCVKTQSPQYMRKLGNKKTPIQGGNRKNLKSLYNGRFVRFKVPSIGGKFKETLQNLQFCSRYFLPIIWCNSLPKMSKIVQN